MNDSEAPAPVVLTVRQHARQPIHLLLRERLTMGRDCDGFLLADTRASRRHAEFRLAGTAVLLRDLGSSNGTTRNGRSIDGEVQLEAGDVIGIGDSEIEVGTAVAVAGATAGRAVLSIRDLSTEMIAAERPRSSIARLSEVMTVDQYAPDLAEQAKDEGTFTIVFSDIENSTVLATSMGDRSWLQVLDVHNDILRHQLARHGGREIKSQGDGFMMSFGSARRAVMFAIDTQREITRRSQVDPDWNLRIRLGIHTGEAVQTSDGDLFGRHVIVASRIADHASGGEILVSSLVRELTAGKVELDYEPGRSITLKGVGNQIVHRVRWTDEPAAQ
jgi:class 3 adenylate cyclase